MALDSRSTWTIRNSTFGFLLLTLASRTLGQAISYCSPDLTAGSFKAVYNTWQSNGACATTCQGSYAYAVLQGSNCWCSNYAPADQVNTLTCNTVCPGWQDDWCGSVTDDLYGYYQLQGVAPSGTAGSSSSTTAGSSVSETPSVTGPSAPPPHPAPVSGHSSSLTVSASAQSSPRTSSSAVEDSSSALASTPEPGSSSTSSSSTHTQSPTVLTSVTTVTGKPTTVLITPTVTSNPTPAATNDTTLGSGTAINSNGGGVSAGKVAGIVVGVALGLGIIIGLGVWIWLRRKHQHNVEVGSFDDRSAHGNTSIPSRQVSQMSSAGLLGRPPRIQTFGLPSGRNPQSADTMGSNFDRRSLATDQRLNPYAIYAHDESRHSNISLQDNQDYSRQLRVANPDP